MANTQISHNGEVIAALNGGQTATLKCAGMQMVTDVVVDVAELSLQEKTATENGEVTPDNGYAGLSKVTVDVPIPDGYIVPSGTKDVTENGEHDVTESATVKVDVQPTLQEKTATENGEVVPDEGFDGLSKVIVDVAVYDGSLTKGVSE